MNPTVCCVMLVNGRAEMVMRAIASFRSQTYDRKRLLIVDSGDISLMPESPFKTFLDGAVMVINRPELGHDVTIGSLRNFANSALLEGDPDAAGRRTDLIAHWDSDDWSHPRRIEEQVALLQASGKQCVGYRELLFWDTREFDPVRYPTYTTPEAWLYRDYNPRVSCGGTWLYRRELWEKYPFMDAPHEDIRWLENLEVSRGMLAVSSLMEPGLVPDPDDPRKLAQAYFAVSADLKPVEPRMVCQMHAWGTEQIPREVMLRGDVWRRAPEYDQYCERTMKL